MNEKMKQTRFKRHIKTQILILALLPMLILALLTCLVSFVMTHSMVKESMETNLKALATSLKDSYTQLNTDKYINKGTEEDPLIYKGSYNVSKHTEIVDSLLQDGGMLSTIFWNDVRIMTSLKDESGNRKIGSKMEDADVVKRVLQDGEGYFDTDFKIGDNNYYVYYLPLYQEGSKSEIVGMVFVGAEAEQVNKSVNDMIMIIVAFVALVIAAAVVTILILVTRLTKALAHGVYVLNQVAEGDLTVAMNPKAMKRKDEIGNLLYAVAMVKDNLINIVSGIKQNSSALMDSSHQLELVAKETENTVEQVGKAVDDIAQGATSQAQETQKASEDVQIMGDMISQTSDEVQVLDENANMMMKSSEEASRTLNELKDTNKKSIEAINIIYEQTNTTNESALKIQAATQLITSIAEETSLLSLNASIEAARAGEQGRGFAVVAAQIQNLAEQSNESAVKIEEIIKSLINDSEKAVQTMQEVKEIMDNQSKNVDKTEKIFETVKSGIDNSFVKVENITEQTENLDEARVSIVDIVQNLTAVAEENAASTQETAAAAEEVTATVANISDEAANLKEIASSLEEQMRIFRL